VQVFEPAALHPNPENKNDGAVMVYADDRTLEFVNVALVANALMVVVAETETAPVYRVVGELLHVPAVVAPGVVPSIV
jgi:hypothetical protein